MKRFLASLCILLHLITSGCVGAAANENNGVTYSDIEQWADDIRTIDPRLQLVVMWNINNGYAAIFQDTTANRIAVCSYDNKGSKMRFSVDLRGAGGKDLLKVPPHAKSKQLQMISKDVEFRNDSVKYSVRFVYGYYIDTLKGVGDCFLTVISDTGTTMKMRYHPIDVKTEHGSAAGR